MDTTELVQILYAHVQNVEEERELSGAELGHILQAITDHEVEEGGPYARRSSEGGERVDLGLNLVIALFLAEYNVSLPNLDEYLSDSLENALPRSVFFIDGELEELIECYCALYEDSNAGAQATAILSEGEQSMLERIRGVAHTRLGHLSNGMQESARFAFERTLKKDSDLQIALISFYVRDALGTQGADISDNAIAELGVANVFFWSASTIYDDFWDEDEDAEPQHLPIANLFARHYADYFVSLFPAQAGFRAYFQEIMDTLDEANSWETRHCRVLVEGGVVCVPEKLPDYEDFTIKFYPAAGHVFGPIAVALLSGFTIDSPEVVALTEYITHLLVARQLNDDLHDWKEDLARGHISTVVAALLTQWNREHPERAEIDMHTDMPELERLFWFSVVTPLAKAVLSHTRRSHRALSSLDLLGDTTILKRFIMSNKQVAQNVLREQALSQEFLSSFRIS